MLSVANFKLALSKLPDHVRIDFSGMAEPWLNPDATEMVDYAYSTGRQVAVYTTLEGLDPEDASMLLRKFSCRITAAAPWVVHLPDNEKNMPGWKASNRYSATLETVLAFKRDNPNAAISFMTMSSTGSVHPDISLLFGQRLDGFVGISRVENLNRNDFESGELRPIVKQSTPIVCASTPFFDHNGMLPNGDVVLCCMDYSTKNIIGNLLTQDYYTMFAGPTMQQVRAKSMQYGYDPDFICKNCENATCLSRTDDSSWRIEGNAYWADPPGSLQEAKSARAHQIYENNELNKANAKLVQTEAELQRLKLRLNGEVDIPG